MPNSQSALEQLLGDTEAEAAPSESVTELSARVLARAQQICSGYQSPGRKTLIQVDPREPALPQQTQQEVIALRTLLDELLSGKASV